MSTVYLEILKKITLSINLLGSPPNYQKVKEKWKDDLIPKFIVSFFEPSITLDLFGKCAQFQFNYAYYQQMDGQIEVVNRKFILNSFVANMRLHGIGEIGLTATGMP